MLPDIILLDMRLPDMHGLEVLAELSTHKNIHAKVYAVSADALPEQVDQAIAAGIDGYLTKPIDLKRLQEVLAA
jgi:CheY-like chemotaxis protein